MTNALTVFRVLTTRASGKARWICSPRLSVLATDSVGGIPCEKSSGLATSMTTLPARRPAPAGLERGDRGAARGRVDDELAVGARLREAHESQSGCARCHSA